MIKKYWVQILLVILGLFYIYVRVIHFIHVPATITHDTKTYMQVAVLSIFQKEFWTGIRPFTYPLILKVFNFNINAVSVLQFIISILAWLWLAFNFSRLLSSRILGLFSFAFILLFSLSTDVILWDRLAETESLNISMIVILFSTLIYNIRAVKKIPVVIIIIFTFFWVFLRDTNAWFGLFFGLLLIGYAILSHSKKTNYIISVVLISFFFLSNFTADLGGRWIIPFLNVLSNRILTNNAYLFEFETRGIPVNSTLLKQKNQIFSQEYFTNPDLVDFRQWLYKDGKSAYMSFLIRNPSYLIQAPFEDWSVMFGYLPITQTTTNDNLDYAPRRFREVISYPFSEVIYPKEFGLTIFFVSFLLMGSLLFQIFNSRHDLIAYLFLALLVCSFPMFILIYHGDASGLSRHAVDTILLGFLTCWLVVLQYLDKVLKTFQAKPAGLSLNN